MHCLLKNLTAHSPPWDLSWWVPLEQDKDSEEEEAETRPFSWVSVGHCLLWILANNCFHAGLQHLMAHVLIYPTSRFCPTYSLFSPYPSNFFLFHYSEGGWKKRSLLTVSTGSLGENLQLIANGLKTFSPIQEYKERAWSLPYGNQADFCCQLLFTEVGNGQKHAPSGHWKQTLSWGERGTRALPASSGPQRGNPLFQATLIHGKLN